MQHFFRQKPPGLGVLQQNNRRRVKSNLICYKDVPRATVFEAHRSNLITHGDYHLKLLLKLTNQAVCFDSIILITLSPGKLPLVGESAPRLSPGKEIATIYDGNAGGGHQPIVAVEHRV